MATQTSTPQSGARLEQVLTIYLTPKDVRELDVLMREKWATMKEGDSSFVKKWQGTNCIVQFHLDTFRTEGAYGKRGMTIPPPGNSPQLTPDEQGVVEHYRNPSSTDSPTVVNGLIAIIDRLTGKANGSDSPASNPPPPANDTPAPENAPKSTGKGKGKGK